MGHTLRRFRLTDKKGRDVASWDGDFFKHVPPYVARDILIEPDAAPPPRRFEVGDRVRVDRCSTGLHNGREGVVRGLPGPGYRWIDVSLGIGILCDADSVSLIAPPDPYQPRDGDEITMSLRGVVHDDGNHGWEIQGKDINLSLEDFEGYEVEVHKRGEKKPKLPTTPGSVIRRDRYIFVRSASGWRRVDVNSHTIIDDGSMKSATLYEILFDASDASASS